MGQKPSQPVRCGKGTLRFRSRLGKGLDPLPKLEIQVDFPQPPQVGRGVTVITPFTARPSDSNLRPAEGWHSLGSHLLAGTPKLNPQFFQHLSL